jgi:hypothetical protein
MKIMLDKGVKMPVRSHPWGQWFREYREVSYE